MFWEKLESRHGTLRAKVPGGWLVWVSEYHGVEGYSSGLTFYPDPEHDWDGTSLP